jgi:hypothetical protein
VVSNKKILKILTKVSNKKIFKILTNQNTLWALAAMASGRPLISNPAMGIFIFFSETTKQI